jgi:hypothetical protein
VAILLPDRSPPPTIFAIFLEHLPEPLLLLLLDFHLELDVPSV